MQRRSSWRLSTRSLRYSGNPIAGLEVLESRRLLAASITLQGTTLVVHGDENTANTLTVIGQSNPGSSAIVSISAAIVVHSNPAQNLTKTFSVGQVSSIQVDGGNGSDLFYVYTNVGKHVTLTDPLPNDDDIFRFVASESGISLQLITTSEFQALSGGTDVVIPTNMENVQLLSADSGGDTFHLTGDFFTPVSVYGMGGNNTIDLDHLHNSFALFGGGMVTYKVLLYGDTINIDDQAAGASTYKMPDYVGSPELVSFDTDNGAAGADIFFGNPLCNVSINAGNENDSFTSDVIAAGMNVTFNGDGGDDSFAIGNSLGSFNAPVTFNGGDGTDSMAIDNSEFGDTGYYDLSNGSLKFGTSSASQIAVNYSGVENTSLVGSPDFDSIRIAPASGNYTIDGGGGFDQITEVGQPSINPPDRYVITSDSVTYLRRITPTGPVFGQVNSVSYSNISVYVIDGSDDRNNFEINSTPADTAFTIFAGGGDDFLQLGDASDSTDSIQSGISFIGQAGANTAVINDQSDTTGKTLHVIDGGVSSYPGDTLFGPGGLLYFSDLAMLTINLGSGPDTIYAQPSSTTDVVINAGDPPAAAPLETPQRRSPLPGDAPGDLLVLGFATAADPVFTPGDTGAGSYAFSNYAPLSYTGVESTVIDDVPPTGLDGEYDFDAPMPTVTVQFSEDVSSLLVPDQLDLINDTTGEEEPSADAFAYDAETNTASFTYPSLPDGNYSATVLDGLTDQAGNQLGEFTFGFFVLAGDANRDRSVGFADLVAVAQNYGGTDKNWEQGDFNGDGNVSFADLVTVAQNYGKQLPEPASPAAAAAVGAFPAGSEDLTEVPLARPKKSSAATASAQAGIERAAPAPVARPAPAKVARPALIVTQAPRASAVPAGIFATKPEQRRKIAADLLN